MNAEPKKNGQYPDHLSFRQALKQLPSRFAKMCLHHWGWKIFSLFLAICLWAGLITQDPTLTRERVFYDVPLSVSGSDTLIRNGMIVLSGLEDEALYVRLRADVPQRTYSTALASNYNPRIDLSRISETGEQTLRILSTSSTTYGTVTSISPETIDVVVDEYVTNYRVPVSLNITGSYPAGYYGASPLIDPSSVAVSGPKTIVDQIANLYVDFDLSRLTAQEGMVRTALPMRFTDKDGNEINSKMLEVTSANVVLRTITVEQRLYPTKTLAVSNLALTTGTPAAGYEVKSVATTPNVLLAAGDHAALEIMETLFADTAVDVTDRSESFVTPITIRKPVSLYYLSETTITLQVEIGPVIDTKTFDKLKVSISGTSASLRASRAEDTRVAVTLTGPQNTLEALSSSDLSVYVDASGLKAGDYALPVMVDVSTEDKSSLSYTVVPTVINVTISEK
ncbi:MAG: CdaR family protein [Eubacteriales bacterium]|nr:CdaR family protein [Eubacteriales bacterium]